MPQAGGQIVISPGIWNVKVCEAQLYSNMCGMDRGACLILSLEP